MTLCPPSSSYKSPATMTPIIETANADQCALQWEWAQFGQTLTRSLNGGHWAHWHSSWRKRDGVLLFLLQFVDDGNGDGNGQSMMMMKHVLVDDEQGQCLNMDRVDGDISIWIWNGLHFDDDAHSLRKKMAEWQWRAKRESGWSGEGGPQRVGHW